jgi:hypothetical protein
MAAAVRTYLATALQGSGVSVNYTMNKPTSPPIKAGDLIFAFVTTDYINTAFTAPSGWTQIAYDSREPPATLAGVCNALFKYNTVATGSEPSSWTWTQGAAAPISGAIFAVSGANLKLSSRITLSNVYSASGNTSNTNAISYLGGRRIPITQIAGGNPQIGDCVVVITDVDWPNIESFPYLTNWWDTAFINGQGMSTIVGGFDSSDYYSSYSIATRTDTSISLSYYSANSTYTYNPFGNNGSWGAMTLVVPGNADIKFYSNNTVLCGELIEQNTSILKMYSNNSMQAAEFYEWDGTPAAPITTTKIQGQASNVYVRSAELREF